MIDAKLIGNVMTGTEVSTDMEGSVGSSLNDEIIAKTIDVTAPKDAPTDNPPTDNPPIDTKPTDNPPIDNKPIDKAPETLDNQGVTDDKPTLDKPADAPVDDTKPKTFGEMLSEKTEGKYTDWESYIEGTKPPEVIEPKPFEFANDTVKKLNELAAQGVNIDSQLLELQSKDFKGMTDPEAILKEEMRMSGRYEGWTDSLLTEEIDEKYKRKEWLDEETGEKTEGSKLMEMRLLRDSREAQDKLIKLQEDRTIIQAVDPQIAINQQAAVEKQTRDWNEQVDSIAKSTTKLTTMIDEKENKTFDYEPTTEEISKATETMKQLGKNPMAIFDQFKKEDGSYDNTSIYNMLLAMATGDKRLRIINTNAKAEGAETEVRDLNNTNFKKKDGTQQTQQVETNPMIEAIKKAKGIT